MRRSTADAALKSRDNRERESDGGSGEFDIKSGDPGGNERGDAEENHKRAFAREGGNPWPREVSQTPAQTDGEIMAFPGG